MRTSREEASRSRARMVMEAARLLRERGAEGVSIADVAAAAGLTHGAFYKHFSSRDALVVEAAAEAFAEQARIWDTRAEAFGPEAALSAYYADYLSEAHVKASGNGCAVAALGSDAGRGQPTLKAIFASGVDDVLDRIVTAVGGEADGVEARAKAIRRFAQLVGTIVIARAVGPGFLRDEVLAAGQPHTRPAIQAVP